MDDIILAFPSILPAGDCEYSYDLLCLGTLSSRECLSLISGNNQIFA